MNTNYYPLTHPQKRIWYTEKVYPGTGISNNGFTIRLKGEIDYTLLEKAINIAIYKNDSLRLRMVEHDDEVMQYVAEYTETKIDFLDFSTSEESHTKWGDSTTKAPFDLTGESLIYFAMLKFSSGGGFFIKRHHIIADGWAIIMLINQIVGYYNDLKNGLTISDDKKPSYIQYILSEEEYKKSAKFEDNKKFWLEKFETILEESFLKPQKSGYESVAINRKIFFAPEQLVSKMNTYCKESNSSVFRLLLAAFYMYISRATSKDDMVIGTIIHNRFEPQTMDMAGMLASTTPIRLSVISDPDFKGLDKLIAKEMKSATRHQRYPYDLLLQDLRKTNKQLRNLFDVLVLYEEVRYVEGINDEWHHNGNETYPLTIRVSEKKEENFLKIEFDYQTALFSDEEAEKIYTYILTLLSNALEDPTKKLSDIEMLSEEELRQVLYEFNDTKAEYPHTKTIHELFEEQVEKTPDNIAVIFEGTKLTYAELNDRANRLAVCLREKGAKPDSIVAIKLERSIEMIVGILGILKSGAAYLPIDPNYPEDRIKFLLEDSGAEVLLTDNLHTTISNGTVQNINKPTDLAYVIYTSGTTGKPKGAMIEHHSVINRLNWMQKRYPLNEKDVILQKTPFTFDVSIWELFWWSFTGAGVCFLAPDGEKDPEAIVNAIDANKVTVMHFVPSMLNVFLEYIEGMDKMDKLSSLKQVFASGEALTLQQVEKFNRLLNKKYGTKLSNLYGPTEATVDVSYFDCSIGELPKIIPIGKPIDNINLYILDKNNKPQPIGIVGELYIAGVGLARGYHNRPDLTAERFVPNPFISGERMYKTGDLAIWLPDGNIEYLGRTDHQVKIRGFRIELGEVECAILGYKSVKEAVVIAREDKSGNKYLCAYFVSNEDVDIATLKVQLSNVLPHYMIPSYFIRLDMMPLTSNGKLDRRALPDSAFSIDTGVEYVAPENETESKLVEIWSGVLEVEKEKISTLDSFIGLGGDSIRAIRVVSRINKAFNTDIQIRDLYKNLNLKELAQFMKQRGDSTPNIALELAKGELDILKNEIFASKVRVKLPDDIEDIYPMSDIEKGMVYYSLKFLGKGVYHDQFLYQIKDDSFDFDTFNSAVSIMISKHQILRTNYNIQDFSAPMRVVHKCIESDVEQIDITNLGKSLQEDYINRFMENDRLKPFNIKNTTKKPLWRIRVFKLTDENICLCWIFHHALMDGWSIASFITELINTYFRLKDNAFNPEEIKSSYKEYILDQMVIKKDTTIADYWRDELKDYKRLTLPSIKATEDDEDRVNVIIHQMDIALMDRLKLTARQLGTSVKAICFAAYVYMFGMISYENDITVGLVENNRPAVEDGDKILGCFLNTVPVRIGIEKTMTWAELVWAVDKKLIDLKLYGKLPLYDIKKAIGEASQEANPIFDMLFNYVDFHIYNRLEKKDIFESTISVVNFERTNTLFDFTVFSVMNQFGARVNFIEPVFSKDDVNRLLNYYVNILTAIIEHSGKVISKESILPKEERNLLYSFNDTKTEYFKEKTINELFEAQVEVSPDTTAVVFGDSQLTYRELNEKANCLALYLRGIGVKQGSIVGIITARSLEMMISILAVLKSGGAYLPIDPEYPDERIQYMLEDSGAEVLLVDNGQLTTENKSLTVVNVKDASIYRRDGSNVVVVNTSSDLAYVIYTSGSTGKPKGVMIEHRAVNNFIKGITDRIEFLPSKTILSVTTISFDIFVLETLLPLVKGLKVVIADENQQRDPRALNEVIVKNNVDMIQTTPSRMQLLLSGGSVECLKDLKEIMLGGEGFPQALLQELHDLTNAKIYNMYGPTETTVWSALGDLTGVKDVSIGKPIANTYIYIVDKNNNLQPLGMIGELCIAGDGLARGYLDRLELTAERFVPNPFVEGEKMYMTGDLARWLPEGKLECVGRIDNQVKIRGFRIELGEIESQLLSYNLINEAVVKAVEDGNGNKHLCAYFTSDEKLTVSVLRELLSKTLPDYMVPSYFIQLEKMPLTPNGKTDLKALPQPDGDIDTGVEYKAPETEAEMLLAEIWCKVMEVERIGVNDSFFDLGGDSIKVMQIIASSEEHNLEIHVSDIFKYKTIAKILKNIENRKSMPEVEDGINDDILPKVEINLSDDIPETKELKINMQNDINTYLNQALPLCVILTNERLIPWFYEHFLQIYSKTDDNGYLTVDFLEGWPLYKVITGQSTFRYEHLENVPDIVQFIAEQINMEYYIVINVDEYYLPEKSSYKKIHYVHPSLIYGYDNNKREFKAVGFNSLHMFDKLIFTYDDFVKAFEGGKIHYKETAPWCEYGVIETIHLREFMQEYPFTLEKFLQKLKYLAYSKSDYSSVYVLSMDWQLLTEEQIKYGINVYDDLITHLGNLANGRVTIDYRAIHLLFEHKKAIDKRLQYIISRYSIQGELVELANDYQKVLNMVDNARRKYLEQAYDLETQFFNTHVDKSTIARIIEMLRGAKTQEELLLKKICEQLEVYIENNLKKEMV